MTPAERHAENAILLAPDQHGNPCLAVVHASDLREDPKGEETSGIRGKATAELNPFMRAKGSSTGARSIHAASIVFSSSLAGSGRFDG